MQLMFAVTGQAGTRPEKPATKPKQKKPSKVRLAELLLLATTMTLL